MDPIVFSLSGPTRPFWLTSWSRQKVLWESRAGRQEGEKAEEEGGNKERERKGQKVRKKHAGREEY